MTSDNLDPRPIAGDQGSLTDPFSTTDSTGDANDDGDAKWTWDLSGAPPDTPQPGYVHPPYIPMGNARLLATTVYGTTASDGKLKFHRGVFRRWNGSAWPMFGDDGMREVIYTFFEHAVYRDFDGPGPPMTLEFNPTKNSVGEILAALKAVVWLDEAIDMPCWLDRPGVNAAQFLAMGNGLLHLPTRTLIPASPRFFTPFAVPYGFDPDAPPPEQWLAFLDDLWPGDEESKQTLQEIIGYLLSSDTSHQKIFLLVGPKRSGKGTIARVIRGLLGPHNVAGPTLASLSSNFGLAPMIDKPVGIISDARLSGRTDGSAVTERLLTISGEDTISIDRKYRDHWTGKMPTRLIVISNELPRFSDSSGALASRFLVLQTTESFYGKEDRGLTDRLLKELPGILNWALDGLDRLNERGYFLQPGSSQDAIKELETLASPVGAFLQECCDLDPSHEIAVKTLFSAWRAWCDENGNHHGTAQTFGRDLHAAVPEVATAQRRTGAADRRDRFYLGVRLKREWDIQMN